MRWKEIVESATAGATGAASVATAVGALGAKNQDQALGVGFDPNGDQGVYQASRKKKPLLIRR